MYLTPLQQYLQDKTPEQLKEELGINFNYHPTLPLVCFKYNQIDSPKTNPVVRECRGIVLERDTWKIVAKPFERFFNWGENLPEMEEFCWDRFVANEKHDGSLIIVFYYNNQWHVNTSGSFGLTEVSADVGMTWRELFWKAAKDIKVDNLNPNLTYIFELCSPYNKIVRTYPEPKVYLLSIFSTVHQNIYEHDHYYVDYLASEINAQRPESFSFTCIEEIEDFLTEWEKQFPSREGLVIRDGYNTRFKIKSKTYLSLHHLCDNGNLFSPKRLIPWVLVGDQTELLTYFPEVKKYLDEVTEVVNKAWVHLAAAWINYKDIESQKDFALAIKDKTKFTGLLFQMRKEFGKDGTLEQLRKKWQDSQELIYKVLF